MGEPDTSPEEGFTTADALPAGEARYREVFTNTATAIVHVRADGTFLEVNPAWAAVLGYDSPEQYVAEVGNARNIWADPAQREAFLRAIAEKDSVNGFEARFRHRAGRIVWVALDARAVRDESGDVVALHTSGLDVTSRMLAEQYLRESEARFRSIFLSSLDGILLTSADDRIISANPAACQILHRTEGELQALSRSSLFDLDGDAAASALTPRSALGPAPVEIPMMRPDGSSFPAEITCSAFTDVDGAQVIIIVIRDVSQRRQIEAELRRAKKTADEANQAKSEFLSRMSHELRTPLNAVLGFAQLFELDLAVDDDRRHAIHQIRQAGRHLLKLINEVLDISRIEAGELGLSAETVLVDELVAEVVALMTPIATAADVAIHATPEPLRRYHVRADRQRMRQVLLNLLSNAVKYNRPGGEVTIQCRERGEDVLGISVRDTGIGISQLEQARLFIPFERLSAASSHIEGTGVGLALSERLATAMGGRISVESTPGQGSIFTLELPRVDGETRADPDDLSDRPAPDTLRHVPDSPHGTLLYIEDNPANVRLLEAVVRRRPGWELSHAGHGQLGLDLAAANSPDLILLDLHLPDMSGAEVLARLKESPATAEVPVVVVSADVTPGQVERLHALGAQGYLTKPIDIKELLELLDTTAQFSDTDIAVGPTA